MDAVGRRWDEKDVEVIGMWNGEEVKRMQWEEEIIMWGRNKMIREGVGGGLEKVE